MPYDLPDPDGADPREPGADWVRGLLSPRVTRRTALQAGGGAALATVLAACGVSGATKTPAHQNSTQAADAVTAYWAKQKDTGKLNFANWPLYIDVGAKSKSDHPSIDLFTKQTGVKVNYQEVIQDDPVYFGKIQPVLAAGQGTGFDLMVITSGIYLNDLLELGYLIPLDQSRMTNFYKNASPLVKNTSYDPGNRYTMAWQSGMTGIGYNPKLTGREITSWQDVLDPAFKGKVGMFGDNQDLPNSALLAIGVNPATSTEADWKKAAAWLKKGKPLVRKYYSQDYVDALSKGDIWISMAWSGDVFQANASGASLKFTVPKEGSPFWTDNMMIPAHAQNPYAAMTWMDYAYQPPVAAMLAEGINYVTPVPKAKTFIEMDAAKASGSDKAGLTQLASSPLIFPPTSYDALLHPYRVLTQAEQTVWNSIFEPIYQS